MVSVLIKNSESASSSSVSQRIVTLRTIYGKFSFDREIISGRQHIHTTVDKRNGHWDKWTWHRVQAHANALSWPPTASPLCGEPLYIGKNVCICVCVCCVYCVLRISWKFPLSIYRPDRKRLIFFVPELPRASVNLKKVIYIYII